MTSTTFGVALNTLNDLNTQVDFNTNSTTEPVGMVNWFIDLGGTTGKVDQIVEQWFFIQVGSTGDIKGLNEYGPPQVKLTDANFNPGDDVLTARYTLDATGSALDLKFTLQGGPVGQFVSDVGEQIKVTSGTTALGEVTIWEYCNFLLMNTADDTVKMKNANTVDQTDGALPVKLAETVLTGGLSPLTHEVGLAAAVLADVKAGTLSGASGPVGPNDVAWAFEFQRTLGATDSFQISKDKNLSSGGGGQLIPEPLTMLGMFLGLGSVGAYIRKRRMS
jgi:hypothetical protein